MTESALDAEVAVIGLGAWGACTLWQLARRGVRAVGLDRFGRAHRFGASHGGSRMFRITCLEHPGLVPLARRSLDLWRELEHDSGRELLFGSGGLLIGSPDSQVVSGTLAAAAQHDIHIEKLDRAALLARYPQHSDTGVDDIGVWEPSAQLIRPEEAVAAALTCAEKAGAQIHSGVQVLGVEQSGDSVRIHTPMSSLRVRRAVVTAGSWLPSLVDLPGTRVLRMPVTWFRPAGTAPSYRLADFPVFMRQLDAETVLWGCGAEGDHDVKLGLEQFGAHGVGLDLETMDRSIGATDWAELSALLPRYLPGLQPNPERIDLGMLTITPDGQFLLGPLPTAAQVLVGGGDNAHGFKHAAGIGEYLADLACDERPRIDLSFADVRRLW
ncbi:N-methyl-L-tryptophan oxidase [Nocardia sp. NPDC088792]|uniref:N-methyl-L-tryptophan oxidase n=1 Tax=Nocardia sp. NPDC088792 TaxID=3364332 RepID=UPI003826A7ED